MTTDLYDVLVAMLWKEVDAGRMPVAIRMQYRQFAELMDHEDGRFFDDVALGSENATFQSLPVYFDKTVECPIIETDPPKEAAKPLNKWV